MELKRLYSQVSRAVIIVYPIHQTNQIPNFDSFASLFAFLAHCTTNWWLREGREGEILQDSITRAITLNERQFKRLWRLDLKLIIDKEPKVVWKTGKRRMKEGERIAMKFLVNRISVWAVHEWRHPFY